MRVTFWGTRGSCPTFPAPWEIREYTHRSSVEAIQAALGYFEEKLDAGMSLAEFREVLQRPPEALTRELTIVELPIWGGETTCVEIVTSEGNILILDGGSGVRHCAAKILRERAETQVKDLYLFGSHEHLDHRLGLSFATFCFADPPFHIKVFGNAGYLGSLDEHFGIFSRRVSEATYHDDPIDYSMMTASFQGIEIGAADAGEKRRARGAWEVRDIADPIQIGSTVVRPFKVYHGSTACLGYKVAHGGKSFVFCTDHEKLCPNEEGDEQGGETDEAIKESERADEEVVALCQGADLAYFDGQYSRDEYYGRERIGSTPAVSRVGWGHGVIEDILERVTTTAIKHALIGHHDPERSWPAQVAMDKSLQEFSAENNVRIELARDGQTIDL